MENDDAELVARSQSGDVEAFTALVVRYQRPVWNAAFWILKSADDASDVAQTVFLKVAEALDGYDPRHRFFSWIYRIAVNESLNVVRSRRREELLDEDEEFPDADDVDPASRFAVGERAARVRQALLSVSSNDRAVLTLRHFGELSYDEIAEVLSVDVKTVKSRLFEARHRMGELLKDLRTN